MYIDDEPRDYDKVTFELESDRYEKGHCIRMKRASGGTILQPAILDEERAQRLVRILNEEYAAEYGLRKQLRAEQEAKREAQHQKDKAERLAFFTVGKKVIKKETAHRNAPVRRGTIVEVNDNIELKVRYHDTARVSRFQPRFNFAVEGQPEYEALDR